MGSLTLFSFSSFQQQHIIFSPVEVWRETKVGFGITAIRSRDSSSLLEAAKLGASGLAARDRPHG